jgi:hypothetical protein
MPRYRTTKDATATLVGKLLILIAAGHETSATLAQKIGVTPRQINRYVLQLIQGGWQIERIGAWTKQDYYFALRSPKISVPPKQRNVKSARRGRGS